MQVYEKKSRFSTKISLFLGDDDNNNECICKAQNKWSSDALHRRADVESFQFPRKCIRYRAIVTMECE